MSQHPPILDYASPSFTAKMKLPPTVRLIVLLLILPTLLSTSLLMAMVEYFDLVSLVLGTPFLVGISLVLCHLRLLIFGELSKIERRIGYIVTGLGIVSIAASAGLVVILAFEKGIGVLDIRLAVAFATASVVIAFGACVVCFLGKRISHGTQVCACLCISYAACLLLQNIAFGWNDPVNSNLGNWLSLPVIAGCLIEITTLTMMAFRRRTG